MPASLAPSPTAPEAIRRPGGWRSALIPALALLVFAVSLLQNLSAIAESQFHPDESRWLNRAHYLRDFVHPTSRVWEDRYLTRGQPPLGSYVIGFGLLVQGRDVEINGPWDFHYGNESTVTWNVVKGNMPAGDDVVAARRTNAVVGALTSLVAVVIVARLANPVGGVAAGLFLAFHPLQLYLSSIAVSDALFTLLVALAALAALALARSPSWPRTILLGVLLGLGAATKLSPLAVAAALAALGAVVLVDPVLRRIPIFGDVWRLVSRDDPGAARRLGLMLLTLPAISFATFVAIYPYLWPDPIGRTRLLLDFRRHEMDNQARIWPRSAIDSRVEALERTWHTLEGLYGTTARAVEFLGGGLGRQWDGLGIDVPLALLGLSILAWYAWRRGITSAHALTLATLGAQSAVILYGLRVDFNRYYLPFVLVCAVGVGMLTAQLAAWIATAARRRAAVAPRQSVAPTIRRRLQTTSSATMRRSSGNS